MLIKYFIVVMANSFLKDPRCLQKIRQGFHSGLLSFTNGCYLASLRETRRFVWSSLGNYRQRDPWKVSCRIIPSFSANIEFGLAWWYSKTCRWVSNLKKDWSKQLRTSWQHIQQRCVVLNETKTFYAKTPAEPNPFYQRSPWSWL